MALNEQDLRHVTEKLGAEWESLATYLGFSQSQIERFRIDGRDRGIGNVMFDMLVTWQHGKPQVINFRKALGEALEKSGRQDLAEQIVPPEDVKDSGTKTSESDSIIKQCRSELCSHYLNTLCKIPQFPGDMEHCVDLEDIYTKMSIDISLPRPCRPIKIPLNSLDDLFTKKVGGRVYTKLLIAAPAGFGKTTSTAKIAHDWSIQPKESPLSDISLLFIINMRWVNHTTNLEDAILAQILPYDTHITKVQLRKVMGGLGDKLVIILDAVDESEMQLFDHPESSGSIMKLLTGRALISCRLIVTTRPWRVPEIVKACKAFTRLDLGGFNKEDVKTYIRKFFKDDESLQQSLIKYMEQNVTIADVCSVPLMTLLICTYWADNKAEEIPNRVSQLYDAILDIMYEHMLSKKVASHGKSKEGTPTNLSLLIQHLGPMALEGLWPPENRLVFSTDEISDQGIVDDACRMGLVSKQEERLRRRSYRKRDSQTARKTKLAFFHKSVQEKCAGEHLANLANLDQEELETRIPSLSALDLRLSSLSTMENALAVQLVLRFASGQTSYAASRILHKLVVIFESTHFSSSSISRYYNEELELDDTLRIQQFLELCLDCNYEADCQDEFNQLLKGLFPTGKVYFLGISGPTALALGYFMENGQPGDIKSITLQPIAHAGDDINPVGPLGKLHKKFLKEVRHLPSEEIRGVCQEYLDKYKGHVHERNEDLAREGPAALVAYIQMWQACQDLPAAEDTNISPIITSLQHTHLEAFNITGFKIGGNTNQLLEAVEKGHMSHLLELRVSNIGMANDQIERLAKAIKHMPHLEVIDTSYNGDTPSGPHGRGLQFMAESLTELKSVHHVDISYMQHTAGMGTIAEKLDVFGPQLAVLNMAGNNMDDSVAIHLESHLPIATKLVELQVSVHRLSRKHHNQLLSTIGHLPLLDTLRIYHSRFPDDLLITAGDTMELLSRLNTLTLNVDYNISPRVSRTTWKYFKTKLQNSEQLHKLQLTCVALEEMDFKEFVQMCRGKGLWHVSYSFNCIPKDVPVPEDGFFNFW